MQRLDDIVRSESKGWNQRYRENMLHIRSGDLDEVAQVVKSLAARDRERGLSMGKRKCCFPRGNILESELCFALDCSPQEIAQVIDQHLET